MADIKVCDRCGKKLTDERTEINVKAADKQDKPRRYILTALLHKKRTSVWCEPDVVKTEHDLCMDCTLELSEWMTSKKDSTEG